MLIRISLIAAIVLSLFVAGINFIKTQEQITTLVTDRNTQRDGWHTTQNQLANTNKVLLKTTAELTKTKADLASTTEERDTAVAVAADLTKKNASMTEALKKTTQDRDTAQDELAAWHALGIPFEKIKATLATLKSVIEDRNAIAEENKILLANNVKLQNQIKLFIDPEYVVQLPPGLKGKVLVADPKYDFVVLDIGEKQGVLPEGQMLVNRNGKLVAKVRIKSVQTDRSIANVLPGWKLSDVMEGDQVLY